MVGAAAISVRLSWSIWLPQLVVVERVSVLVMAVGSFGSVGLVGLGESTVQVFELIRLLPE